MLTIAEEIFLLACHDPDGNYKHGRHKMHSSLIALGGIFELVLQEGLVPDVGEYISKMELEDIYNQMQNKPQFGIKVYDKRATDDPVLDFILKKIGKLRNKTSKKWANIIGRSPEFLALVERSLIEKRVLKKVKKKFLGLIPYTILASDNIVQEANMRIRLNSVLKKTTSYDDRSIALLSILHNTSLARIFQKAHKDIYYVLRDYIEARRGYEKVVWLVQSNFDINDYYKINLSKL